MFMCWGEVRSSYKVVKMYVKSMSKMVLLVVFICFLYMHRKPHCLEYMYSAFITGTCYCYYEKRYCPITKWIKNNTLL